MESAGSGKPHKLSRFSLWIDAVGGYLVCPFSEILVGQATANSNVDVAVVADIAAKHFRLTRNPDFYVLEPLADLFLDGQVVTVKTPLKDGQRIRLKGGVEFKFRKPHPLSMTATLDIVSRQRTRPWSDGILLMADSCLVGPSPRNHVVCVQWRSDLVFFRREDQLCMRSGKPYTVDGQPQNGVADLGLNSRVIGEDYSFSLESVPNFMESGQDSGSQAN